MSEPFAFAPLGPEHLELVRDIEREAIAHLERPDLLRRNTEQMWRACLQPPHLCIGAWCGEPLQAIKGEPHAAPVLAGFAVLYVPEKGGPEDLSCLLTNMNAAQYLSANYKICIVHPGWRGHHLQVQLGQRLAAAAKARGINLLCATASPYNPASVKSLLQLGYHEDSRVEKYGFERILFYQIN
ncbi:MAG: hypothetical protein IJ785_04195 [Bacteroidales bacterium]|nr:hypothetical protein [Bacteroidales bacterium]